MSVIVSDTPVAHASLLGVVNLERLFFVNTLPHWIVMKCIIYFHYFTLHWPNLWRVYSLFMLSRLMVTLQHCLKVACCLLAHCVIEDDNHISLLFHMLFEEKKWWLTLALTLQNWVLCSKSHECKFDAQMIPTWCFLGRKNGIEEFKPTTCTIILVSSVFQNSAM